MQAHGAQRPAVLGWLGAMGPGEVPPGARQGCGDGQIAK